MAILSHNARNMSETALRWDTEPDPIYPGAERLEAFLDASLADPTGQAHHSKAAMVFPSRPGDHETYSDHIGRIELTRRQTEDRMTKLRATLKLVSGDPSFLDDPREEAERSPLKSIMERADVVSKNNLALGTTKQELSLRPGELATKFPDVDNPTAEPISLQRRLRDSDRFPSDSIYFGTYNFSEFEEIDYDGIELPQFEGDLKTIRAALFDFEIWLDGFSYNEDWDESLQKCAPNIFSEIDALINTELVSTATVWMAEDDALLARFNSIVISNDWSGFIAGSPEEFVLRECMARSKRIKYEFLIEWLAMSENTGLTLAQEVELKHTTRLMAIRNTWEVTRLLKGSSDDIDTPMRSFADDFEAMQDPEQCMSIPPEQASQEERRAIHAVYAELIADLKQHLDWYTPEDKDHEYGEKMYTEISGMLDRYGVLMESYEEA
jgi:hypothetical protein